MPTNPKVMSGARAKVGFGSADPTYVGIYNNFSYGVVYDLTPTFILGRLTAASLDYTAVEPVSASGNAYRVLKHGPHEVKGGQVPRLKDLLTFDALTMVVVDRLNPNLIFAKLKEVKPGGYNTSLTARQLEEMTIPYTGLLVDDEGGVNSEPADSLGFDDLQ